MHYSDELGEKICGLIADGMSLKEVCRQPDMPDRVSVYLWFDKHESFFSRYARAVQIRTEDQIEEIDKIAAEKPECTTDGDGWSRTSVDSAGIQRNKLRVDTRKWIASKMLPKKYGDKITQEIAGANGGPLVFQVERMGKPAK